jgi:hypothetical protein
MTTHCPNDSLHQMESARNVDQIRQAIPDVNQVLVPQFDHFKFTIRGAFQLADGWG